MVQIAARRSIADISDIAYYVVSHLDPDSHPELEDAYAIRQTLAQLARTCRNFTRPALKMLWKHLPDDQPLADLLCTTGIAQRRRTPDSEMARGSRTTALVRFEVPIQLHPGVWASASQRKDAEQSWKALRGFDDQYTLCQSGDPSTHPRWKDFEAYASYVRCIALFAFDGPKWCELWQELVSRLGPTRPILPNLQSVSLNAISAHKLTASAFLLVSPSITTLHFAFQHGFSRVRAALPRAFDRAPAIDTLRLSVAPWENMHAHCPHLRRISIIPPLDEVRLRHLADFSELRSLSISLSDTFTSTNQLALLSLDALDIKGDWPCLTDLLTGTHAPNLSLLSLEAWDPGTPATQVAQAATNCVRALSAAHSSLTSLTIRASYGCAPLTGGCVARSIPIVQDVFAGSLLDIARPLLALHDLRTLALIFPDYLDLDCSEEEELRAMAEAWPDLEELHVEFWEYFRPMGMEHPRGERARARGGPVGVGALDHFKRNCPRLRTLRLPGVANINGRDLDSDRDAWNG